MNIKKIKAEVKFINIEIFEPFEYQGKIYLRLPVRICTVDRYIGNGLTEEAKGDFNAVLIKGHANNDYIYLKQDTMVRPLKAELKIYE
jgi:hypothetical protein